jgi:hypothetical protein
VLALEASAPAEVHSVEYYRSVLARGAPLLRLPDPPSILATATACADEAPEAEPSSDLAERIFDYSNGGATMAEIKLAVLSFVASGVFEREPPDRPLRHQRLTLRSGLHSSEQLLAELRGAIKKKLDRVLGEVDLRIVYELIPPNPE